MDDYLEQRKDEEFREALRGHDQDEGYAERYLKTTDHRIFWKKQFVEPLLGVIALLVILFGMVTNLLLPALFAALALGFVILFIWGWKKIAGIRRRERLYNEAVQRQNGTDVRFGRTGADRKKK